MKSTMDGAIEQRQRDLNKKDEIEKQKVRIQLMAIGCFKEEVRQNS